MLLRYRFVFHLLLINHLNFIGLKHLIIKHSCRDSRKILFTNVTIQKSSPQVLKEWRYWEIVRNIHRVKPKKLKCGAKKSPENNEPVLSAFQTILQRWIEPSRVGTWVACDWRSLKRMAEKCSLRIDPFKSVDCVIVRKFILLCRDLFQFYKMNTQNFEAKGRKNVL